MLGRGRQLIAIMLVAAMCIFAASSAMAQKGMGQSMHQGGMQGGGSGNGHGGGQGMKHFSATGTVVAIDADAFTATLNLTRANQLLKQYIGTDFNFTISENVVVKSMGSPAADLTLDEVLVDDTVRVMGTKVGNTYEINRIIVY